MGKTCKNMNGDNVLTNGKECSDYRIGNVTNLPGKIVENCNDLIYPPKNYMPNPNKAESVTFYNCRHNFFGKKRIGSRCRDKTMKRIMQCNRTIQNEIDEFEKLPQKSASSRKSTQESTPSRKSTQKSASSRKSTPLDLRLASFSPSDISKDTLIGGKSKKRFYKYKKNKSKKIRSKKIRSKNIRSKNKLHKK